MRKQIFNASQKGKLIEINSLNQNFAGLIKEEICAINKPTITNKFSNNISRLKARVILNVFCGDEIMSNKCCIGNNKLKQKTNG